MGRSCSNEEASILTDGEIKPAPVKSRYCAGCHCTRFRACIADAPPANTIWTFQQQRHDALAGLWRTEQRLWVWEIQNGTLRC
ncbi:hypothetical protein KCP70_14880 [Salmonella enterica subsp. enterica]|nr:hypothetical protein KCP70_14880 [Salmonella enterica subsp. enterica]